MESIFSKSYKKWNPFLATTIKNGIHFVQKVYKWNSFPQKQSKHGIYFHSFCGNWIPCFAKTIKMESILSSKREQSSTIVHFSHRFTLILWKKCKNMYTLFPRKTLNSQNCTLFVRFTFYFLQKVYKLISFYMKIVNKWWKIYIGCKFAEQKCRFW